MKTKEEILDEANGFFYLEDYVYHKESVKKVMEEYAKEVHFAYKQWVSDIVDEGGDKMEKLKSLSDEELFNQFIQSHDT